MSLDLALPEAWPLVLPALALIAGGWALELRRREALVDLAGPRAAELGATRSTGRVLRSHVLWGAALLLTLFAVLQPRWGETERDVEQKGVDLVVCLDVSRSMLAQDVAPDRLGAARREIAALAERARADRLALVVFAGSARLLVPLTRDHDSLLQLASTADPLSVERGGTDLEAALRVAETALGDATGEHEAILLVTDGEDHGGRGRDAAEALGRRGIAVHTAAVGSEPGGKIPVVGDDGKTTFLRDAAGRDVVTRADGPGLARVASAAGGGSVRIGPDAGSSSLVSLYDDHVAPLVRKVLESERRRERPNRFQWPLAAAFLLGILHLCRTDRRAA